MPELINDPIQTNERLNQLGLDSITPTTGEVLGATWDETFARNPTPSLWRWFERGQYQDGYTIGADGNEEYVPAVPSKILGADEANQKYGITDGAGKAMLKFDTDTPEPVAQELYQLKREELQRRDVMRRAEGGLAQGTAQFGVGLIGSILDPLNIASAFIPVVGPTRYGAMIAGAAGAGERALIRGAVGGAEGLVGAALLEPIVYGVAKSEQADYDLNDSLLNLAFGTVLGGGLHTSFGAVGDAVTGRFARQIDNAPLEIKDTALRSAVAALVEDVPVRVDPLFRRDGLMNSTSLSRTVDIEAGMRATESPTIRAAEAPAETPMTRADWQRLISDGVNSNIWVDRFDSATIVEVGSRTIRDDLTPLMRSETELNDAMKMLTDLEKTGHLDPADVAFVREADTLISEANEFGKAAEVAAMCLMRGA